MPRKKDFFQHPISGFALVLMIATLLLFTVTPGSNSLNALDPNDYFVINTQEHIESTLEVDKLITVMNAANIAKTVLVGSPQELLSYQGEQGFSGYDENNEKILEIAEEYDERFYAFCTIDPSDPSKLTKLQECIATGGDGLKLYNGHSFFYDEPLDDNSMLEIYSYVEENEIPVIMHVNTGYYLNEFKNVLTLYPDMEVICSHFCLSSKNPSQIAELLIEYPNLYIDISFGYKEYLHDGLVRISENMGVFKELFEGYSDRFVFGVTALVTSDEEKNEDWLVDTYQTYRDLLEKGAYTTFHVEGRLNGLTLNDEILKKIYFENWEKIIQ